MTLLIAVVSASASADQTLQSEDDPVQVELKTALDVETVQHGDSFQAVLKEDHRYGNNVLPAGTVIQGKVQAARVSRSMAMPGYVRLDIRQVTFPSGHTYSFEEDGSQMTTAKVMHPDAVTVKKAVKSAVPFSLVSAADGIPLKYAAGMSTWQIIPISLAARMTLGAVLESTKKEQQWHERKGHPTPTRYGHGLLRGTGVTGLYYFLKPSPHPDLSEGAVIPLHLEKDQLAKLFEAGNKTTATTHVYGMLQQADSTNDSAD